MSALGFIKDIEYLVNFDKFDDSRSQRRLFLEFYNTQVGEDMKFSRAEICFNSSKLLSEIFVIKVCSLLGINSIPFIKPLNSKKISRVYFSADIHNFLSGVKIPKIGNISKKISFDSAKRIIKLIGGSKLELNIDAGDAFKNFVLNKLLKDQKSRYIEHTHNSISIIPSYEEPLMIYPFWEMVDKSKPLIDEHIQKAIDCIKQSDFKQVYLVYPKTSDFEKHIEVKIRELENNIACSGYVLKVIPYSLRSILR